MYAGRGARLFLAGRDPGQAARAGRGARRRRRGLVRGRSHRAGRGRRRGVGRAGGAGRRAGRRGDRARLAGRSARERARHRRGGAHHRRRISSRWSRCSCRSATISRRRARGHIAVMSSVAGDRGRPRNYTYGAAKGALNIYLQGLRTRLWPRGVGVHTLKLGPVDTPMTADAREDAAVRARRPVAADIVAAIDAGRAEAYVPWYWRPHHGGRPQPARTRAAAAARAVGPVTARPRIPRRPANSNGWARAACS